MTFNMKIYIFVSYCLVLGMEICTCSEANDKRIVCYFLSNTDNFKRPYNYGPGDIPTELCTDLVFDNVRFNNETFEIENTNSDKLHQFTTLGSPFGPNLLLGVGGELDNRAKWSSMVSDAHKRSFFVSSALQFVRDRGFHGLDLHWNSPKEVDKENFVKLVEELVDAFKPYKLLLTSVVYLDKIRDMLAGYNIQRLSELLDWMHVLTTDLRGTWNTFVDVPSPLYRKPSDVMWFRDLNVHDGMEVLSNLGAPRHKLAVVVGFKGKQYTLQSSSTPYLGAPLNASVRQGDPGPITEDRRFLAYYEICRMISIDKWSKRFDHDGKCPYTFRGDQWVGYEDEQSIRIKMEYIKKRGYRGAGVLPINFDDFNGFCGSKNPLLNTVYDVLSRKEVDQTVDSSELMLHKRYEAMGIVPPCLCKC